MKNALTPSNRGDLEWLYTAYLKAMADRDRFLVQAWSLDSASPADQGSWCLSLNLRPFLILSFIKRIFRKSHDVRFSDSESGGDDD